MRRDASEGSHLYRGAETGLIAHVGMKPKLLLDGGADDLVL
jgi:hypothetical protein